MSRIETLSWVPAFQVVLGDTIEVPSLINSIVFETVAGVKLELPFLEPEDVVIGDTECHPVRVLGFELVGARWSYNVMYCTFEMSRVSPQSCFCCSGTSRY